MAAKKLKIIVTASTYPRWNSDSVPTFIHDQLTFLKSNHPDWDIIALVPHHKGAKRFEITDYGEVRRFRYFYPEKYQSLVYPAILPNLQKNKWLYFQIPLLIISEFLALLKLVIRTKPDFIYSHWFFPQGVVGGMVGLITGVSHVYTSHSSDVLIARKIPFLGPLTVRVITKLAKRITVVSRRSYEKLESFYSEKRWSEVADKVKIIPMGVDISAFSQAATAKSELKIRHGYDGKNIILFIGRLVEKKGVHYLLQAIAEYRKHDPDVLLVVAGDGPLRDDLNDQATGLGVNNYVDFVGHTVGHKKLELFSICDVLILPSIIAADGDAEGVPVVLMEGLAAAKLCIATDVSGADDLLEHGVDGFLIRQKCSSDIVNTLLQIKNMDETAKKRISNNAISKSQQTDWNRIVERHVEHLFHG